MAVLTVGIVKTAQRKMNLFASTLLHMSLMPRAQHIPCSAGRPFTYAFTSRRKPSLVNTNSRFCATAVAGGAKGETGLACLQCW